jgi:hypothetical protein
MLGISSVGGGAFVRRDRHSSSFPRPVLIERAPGVAR